MYVEVEANPNCAESVFIRFREQGPPRPVIQVRLYDRVSTGEWYWVTGWQSDPAQPHCVATGQPVEDSGSGVVYLVSGGSWGLRLKPVLVNEDWALESAAQWGEAYLLLTERRDIRFAEDGNREAEPVIDHGA
jgi:hypothetical protein